MGLLKNEYKSFLDDIEKNIKNKDDLNYIKERFNSFMDIVLNQMDYIMDYKADKIKELENTQKELDNKMVKMQEVISNIEKDIYLDDEDYDLEIVCPYCDTEFEMNIDENKTEIECPECQNIIELDWSSEDEQEGNYNKGFYGHTNYDEDDDM